MLEESIKKAQSRDSEAVLFLIEKFRPLLQKYARKLGYEDAFYDLQFDLLQIILTMDLDRKNIRGEGALVNYISISVFHAYCKRLDDVIQYQSQIKRLDDLSGFQRDKILRVEQSFESRRLPCYPTGLLTEKEDRILRLIYEQELSSAEIARRFHTSRQNVNQCKKRAEQKLRRYYQASTQPHE